MRRLLDILYQGLPALGDNLILRKALQLKKKVVRINDSALPALHLPLRKIDHAVREMIELIGP